MYKKVYQLNVFFHPTIVLIKNNLKLYSTQKTKYSLISVRYHTDYR